MKREWVVTVKDLCPECNKLEVGVQWWRYCTAAGFSTHECCRACAPKFGVPLNPEWEVK